MHRRTGARLTLIGTAQPSLGEAGKHHRPGPVVGSKPARRARRVRRRARPAAGRALYAREVRLQAVAVRGRRDSRCRQPDRRAAGDSDFGAGCRRRPTSTIGSMRSSACSPCRPRPASSLGAARAKLCGSTTRTTRGFHAGGEHWGWRHESRRDWKAAAYPERAEVERPEAT